MNLQLSCYMNGYKEIQKSLWILTFVGWPSQTSCVDPRYLALKRTPSINTLGSVTGPKTYI